MIRSCRVIKRDPTYRLLYFFIRYHYSHGSHSICHNCNSKTYHVWKYRQNKGAMKVKMIRKLHSIYALLTIFPIFIVTSCDMHNIVKLQPVTIEQQSTVLKRFTFENAKDSLSPIVKENSLSCKKKEISQERLFSCKTWAFSTTTLEISDSSGGPTIKIEDTFPTLWTPQPFGKISSEVTSMISREYGVEQVNCRYGFGLFGTCKEWRKE